MNQNTTSRPSAGLFRRLAAGSYDLVLVIALWVIATLLLIVVRSGEPVPTGNFYYQAMLLLLAVGFFAGFWVWGGQTLGMRAWRMQVRSQKGEALTPGRALLRLAVLLPSMLPLGLGLLWLVLDREGLALHDRLSGTRVIVLPAKADRN